jgi:hypothetical protein
MISQESAMACQRHLRKLKLVSLKICIVRTSGPPAVDRQSVGAGRL